ncbi:MAG: hypothetical protein L0229_22360 [Blastocatellia bacterium]|nr:hypothetical protein [Blastocatellia bacterium]
MRTKMISTAILMLLLNPIGIEAQKRKYLRIREKPVIWFNFSCATKGAYSRAKLDRIVKPYLEKIPFDMGKWGDRAFAYDLNGDKVKELFVPLDCGAVGNCNWGTFSVKPVYLIGMSNGENIWVHKRQSNWSQLTVGSHLNVSESLLRTYRFINGRYRKFGKDYIASAYKDNSPENLYLVEPTCDPNWIPKKLRK